MGTLKIQEEPCCPLEWAELEQLRHTDLSFGANRNTLEILQELTLLLSFQNFHLLHGLALTAPIRQCGLFQLGAWSSEVWIRSEGRGWPGGQALEPCSPSAVQSKPVWL